MDSDVFAAVLDAARQGDEAALRSLYESYSPLVYGYVRGRGAREPEDLTSETFVAMVRNVGRFRGDERSFRSWLLTIAHRRVQDERRRVRRRPEDPSDPHDLELPDTAADAADEAMRAISNQQLLAVLDALTDEQREVVVLRIVADLPVKDVARIVGKRQGAVKTMYRRAIANLERALRERDEADRTATPDADETGGAFPDSGARR